MYAHENGLLDLCGTIDRAFGIPDPFAPPEEAKRCAREVELFSKLAFNVAAIAFIEAFGVIDEQSDRRWLATNLGAVVDLALFSLASCWG